VASEASSATQDDWSSSFTSSSTKVLPFEIWYWDNSEDYPSLDPFSWVDPDVWKVLSVLIRASSILGTAKKICQPGPWSVTVRPCRPEELVNGQLATNEALFFFLYDTIPSKLGVKLPFTAFERSILCALNVAPWKSLSSCPRQKLLKPFLESFKIFKDKYFKVDRGATGPNILADKMGSPFFLLYWTSQPVVSVTIVRKDLEKWEDKFITELENLPLLSCADLIKGTGSFIQFLKNMKRKTSQQADGGTSAQATPLSVADPPMSPSPLEESHQSPPIIILDSPRDSSLPKEADPHLGEKRPIAVGEESQEYPCKCLNLKENLAFKTPTSRASPKAGLGMDFEAIITGRPSGPSLWTCSKSTGKVADRGLLTSTNGPLVQQLGVAGTLSTL
ncbi:hypothetical protein CR513_29431, partial [Mucuna pruriens]